MDGKDSEKGKAKMEEEEKSLIEKGRKGMEELCLQNQIGKEVKIEKETPGQPQIGKDKKKPEEQAHGQCGIGKGKRKVEGETGQHQNEKGEKRWKEASSDSHNENEIRIATSLGTNTPNFYCNETWDTDYQMDSKSKFDWDKLENELPIATPLGTNLPNFYCQENSDFLMNPNSDSDRKNLEKELPIVTPQGKTGYLPNYYYNETFEPDDDRTDSDEENSGKGAVSETESSDTITIQTIVVDVDKTDIANDATFELSLRDQVNVFLRKMEAQNKFRPLVGCSEMVQRKLDPETRITLIGWLEEISDGLKLSSETLYLTVSLIDRFWSRDYMAEDFPLLGVSAMFIAAKYEVILAPTAASFRQLYKERTGGSLTAEELPRMEFRILNVLRWELGNPTIITFISRFINDLREVKTDDKEVKTCDWQMAFMAFYLGELSLLDCACVKFLPSTVAASILFLARHTIEPNLHPWTIDLKRITTYKPSSLRDCILIIHDFQLRSWSNATLYVVTKYGHEKFRFVSSLRPSPKIPDSFFEFDYPETSVADKVEGQDMSAGNKVDDPEKNAPDKVHDQKSCDAHKGDDGDTMVKK